MLPRHLPALDGLRAIAVLLVLWTHVPPTITPGYPTWLLWAHTILEPGALGVEIFFVLSGFLITRILLAERREDRPVRWFLLRRVLRIFPIYYLLIAILAVVRPGGYLAWCATYTSNVLTITRPAEQFPLQHSWSLCVEEHFYLLWPLAVAFTSRRRPLQVILAAMPVMLGAAFAVGALCDRDLAMRIVAHASPIRFFSLASGCLIACGEPWLMARPGRLVAIALALVVPALAANNLVLYVLVPQWTGGRCAPPLAIAPGLWLLALTSSATIALLTTLAFGGGRWSPWRLLSWAPLRAVGRISYGLYLYHLPIFHALLRPTPSGMRIALAVSLAFLAASLSYTLIERPILRYGSRLR
ncbi:MAG: acyltransferase [Planctomycetota bacterium]